jgi:hypothetical protein
VSPLADPALGFWLRHVAATGGLWEPDGDAAYVVLPPPLRDAYNLPEELRVTADPEVAREDGATLLAAGHAVLAEAAERVLASGDTGQLVLARPASVPPGRDVLLAQVREAFPVDHGRIDLSGEPEFVLHPVIRVGALVTYELSAEDRFQEEAQRWVDVPSRRELPADLVTRLCRAEADERAVARRPEGLLPAVAAAHRLIDVGAAARRQALAAEVTGSFQAEHGRAAAYYADAIAGIERRLSTAPPERRAVLEQRLRSTREEQARRIAEIEEKYQARHAIRPYRLHVLLVPALRVPADVLRGDRRYPMRFDWLLPAGACAPVRCPSCDGEAPLVAGKLKLGCETCLPQKPPAAAPSAAKPAVPGASSAPTPGRPAPATPRGARPASAAEPVPPSAKPVPPDAKPVPPKARPVPPRAKREPAVPPQVRKQQQKAVATLAERLWRAVAAGDRRALSRLLCVGSPAVALDRILGPAGFCRVLGMPPGEEPERFVAEADGDVIDGVLLGAAGTECPYQIRCQAGQVAEVLPFPVGHDGALWGFYWWGERPGARWAADRIVPARGLDPVEAALAANGAAWNGLPVAVRALAAWSRIAADQQRLLATHPPVPLAAAVYRLVACRAGGRGTFAEAAAAFRVPEPDVRKADRAVRVPLALGPGRPW